MSWRRILPWALAIYVFSFALSKVGIWFGHAFIPPGDGIKNSFGITHDLFRFDAEYYFSIATSGYAYNGDPLSSPNIVFAPLFPILVWLISWLPFLDELTAGFLLNAALFIGALALLIEVLSRRFGRWPALFTTFALATSAGSYSFHAYYSESTMLFTLALVLFFTDQERPLAAGLSAAALGASRLAALPFSVGLAAYWLFRFIKDRNWRFLAAAAVAPLGAVLFLGYIGLHFGNPFRLLPEIQSGSWGFFHPETSVSFLLGPNLIVFLREAIDKGLSAATDIKAINLGWTLLALTAVIYGWLRGRRDWLMALFTAYFAFVYFTGAGSDFLISAHRFYNLMLPIFFMGTDLCLRLRRRSVAASWVLSGLLILLNLAYSVFHTASFNQGVWYFF